MQKRKIEGFDPQLFLSSLGTGHSIVHCKPGQVVYRQGDSAPVLFYVQQGRIQISVISGQGKEGVTAIHGPGELFGQESLSRSCTRRGTAVAAGPATIVKIDNRAITRVMSERPQLAMMFINFVLWRNVQVEEDLVDHLFNPSEKRLARLLLQLAGVDEDDESCAEGTIPKMSQEVLASRIGTTRGRINYFMNKFRDLGHIDYNGAITVRASLASILSDENDKEQIGFADMASEDKVRPMLPRTPAAGVYMRNTNSGTPWLSQVAASR